MVVSSYGLVLDDKVIMIDDRITLIFKDNVIFPYLDKVKTLTGTLVAFSIIKGIEEILINFNDVNYVIEFSMIEHIEYYTH